MCDDIKPELPDEERSNAARRSVGHDQAHEQRLLEYLDGRTSAGESRAMREHLAECAQCSAIAREWGDLDAQLTARLNATISPGFSELVWRAIESLPTQPAGTAAEDASVPDSGWPAAWARHRRRYFWTHLPAALDQLGYAFAVVLAVCLSVRIMPTVLNAWPTNLHSTWLALLAYGLGVSAPVLLFGLAWLAKRPLARLLACL